MNKESSSDIHPLWVIEEISSDVDQVIKLKSRVKLVKA